VASPIVQRPCAGGSLALGADERRAANSWAAQGSAAAIIGGGFQLGPGPYLGPLCLASSLRQRCQPANF
jgi:hypothetical protein